MPLDLNKIANVLEAAAELIDAADSETAAQANAAREEKIATVAEKLASVTGEPISDELLATLAHADTAVLDAVEKVAETRTETVRLGGPADDNDLNAAPGSKKEAADQAEEAFLNWIIS